jgi:hypothetical protein
VVQAGTLILTEEAVMSVWYRIGGGVLGAGGVLWVFVVPVSDGVIYQPVAGIGVFAVLYVIAQAVERLVEWTIEGLTLLDGSPGKQKAEAVRRMRTANSPGAVAPLAVADQSTAEKATTDIAFLSHGLSILLCAIAVNLLAYGIMKSLGADGVPGDVDRLLTALAAAGGSKSLHELIGRLQSAKEQAQVSA